MRTESRPAAGAPAVSRPLLLATALFLGLVTTFVLAAEPARATLGVNAASSPDSFVLGSPTGTDEQDFTLTVRNTAVGGGASNDDLSRIWKLRIELGSFFEWNTTASGHVLPGGWCVDTTNTTSATPRILLLTSADTNGDGACSTTGNTESDYALWNRSGIAPAAITTDEPKDFVLRLKQVPTKDQTAPNVAITVGNITATVFDFADSGSNNPPNVTTTTSIVSTPRLVGATKWEVLTPSGAVDRNVSTNQTVVMRLTAANRGTSAITATPIAHRVRPGDTNGSWTPASLDIPAGEERTFTFINYAFTGGAGLHDLRAQVSAPGATGQPIRSIQFNVQRSPLFVLRGEDITGGQCTIANPCFFNTGPQNYTSILEVYAPAVVTNLSNAAIQGSVFPQAFTNKTLHVTFHVINDGTATATVTGAVDARLRLYMTASGVEVTSHYNIASHGNGAVSTSANDTTLSGAEIVKYTFSIGPKLTAPEGNVSVEFSMGFTDDNTGSPGEHSGRATAKYPAFFNDRSPPAITGLVAEDREQERNGNGNAVFFNFTAAAVSHLRGNAAVTVYKNVGGAFVPFSPGNTNFVNFTANRSEEDATTWTANRTFNETGHFRAQAFVYDDARLGAMSDGADFFINDTIAPRIDNITIKVFPNIIWVNASIFDGVGGSVNLSNVYVNVTFPDVHPNATNMTSLAQLLVPISSNVTDASFFGTTAIELGRRGEFFVTINATDASGNQNRTGRRSVLVHATGEDTAHTTTVTTGAGLPVRLISQEAQLFNFTLTPKAVSAAIPMRAVWRVDLDAPPQNASFTFSTSASDHVPPPNWTVTAQSSKRLTFQTANVTDNPELLFGNQSKTFFVKVSQTPHNVTGENINITTFDRAGGFGERNVDLIVAYTEVGITAIEIREPTGSTDGVTSNGTPLNVTITAKNKFGAATGDSFNFTHVEPLVTLNYTADGSTVTFIRTFTGEPIDKTLLKANATQTWNFTVHLGTDPRPRFLDVSLTNITLTTPKSARIPITVEKSGTLAIAESVFSKRDHVSPAGGVISNGTTANNTMVVTVRVPYDTGAHQPNASIVSLESGLTIVNTTSDPVLGVRRNETDNFTITADASNPTTLTGATEGLFVFTVTPKALPPPDSPPLGGFNVTFHLWYHDANNLSVQRNFNDALSLNLHKDGTPPRIDDIRAAPQTQEFLGDNAVTVSMSFLDNHPLAALATVVQPNGTAVELNLTRNANTGRYENRSIYFAPGNYTFRIAAVDRANNTNVSESVHNWFRIGNESVINETVAPTITGVAIVPSSVEWGRDAFNVTAASVTDNAGIASGGVSVAFSQSGTTRQTIPMSGIGLSGTNQGGYFYNTTLGTGTSAFNWSEFTVGVINVTVTALDVNGNNGTSSLVPFTATDTLGPAFAAVAVTPTNVSLGGTATFTGTVTDAGTVSAVQANVTRSGANETIAVVLSRVGSTTAWSGSRAFDTAGTYAFHLFATDGGGRPAESAASTFTVSGTAAPASFSNRDPPANGFGVATPTIRVDVLGSVTTITMTVNGADVTASLVKTTITGGTRAAYTPTTAFTHGATVAVAAAAAGESTAWNFTVDANAPTTGFTIGQPSFRGRTTDLQNVTTATPITFTASDGSTESGVDEVRYSVARQDGTVSPLLTIAGATGSFRFSDRTEFAAAMQSRYTVSYQAVDEAGNLETLKTFTIFVDAAGPAVSHTPTGATVTATITDPSGVASAKVRYRVGTAGDFTDLDLVASATDPTVYSVTLPLGESGGAVDYFVDATDRLSQTTSQGASAGTPYRITLGNQKPEVTITSPAVDAIVNGTVTVVYQATDPEGSALTLSAGWTTRGGTQIRTIASGLGRSGSHAVDTTKLPDGEIDLVIQASDGELTGEGRVSVKILNAGIRVEPPAAAKEGDDVTIQANVFNPTKQVSEVTAKVKRDGEVVDTITLTSASGGVYSGTYPKAAEGEYTVDVLVRYTDGTSEERVAATSFEVAGEGGLSEHLGSFILVLVLGGVTIALAAYAAFVRWPKG